MSNIQHSTSSPEWYTPPELVHLSSLVLGRIDLDPASSEEANLVVKASQYWTKSDDSLSFEWSERIKEPVSVFLNPPSSGKLPGNKSWAGTYWAKLMDFRAQGMLKHAIFLGFSLEQLAVTQSYHEHCMCQFTSCVPKRRTRFVSPNGEKNSPTHSNIIVYVDGTVNAADSFVSQFETLGCILNRK